MRAQLKIPALEISETTDMGYGIWDEGPSCLACRDTGTLDLHRWPNIGGAKHRRPYVVILKSPGIYALGGL